MLGHRIRQLRQQLGLSQQQLAGEELSRSLICRIEKGECMPSLESLRVIARRLGKPLEYFVSDREDQTKTETLDQLLSGAGKVLNTKPSEAIALAKNAVNFSRQLGRPDLEGRSLMLLGRAYFRVRQYDHAVEACENAAEAYRTANSKGAMAEALYEAGKGAQYGEDLPACRRYYNRVLRVTENLKDLSDLRARTLINLGTCSLRMGDGNEALNEYKEALQLCQSHGLDLELQGQALIGVGLTKRQLKDLPAAKAAITDAIYILAKAQDALLVVGKHNLAIVLADLHQWDSAYELFQECADHFHREGQIVREAAVFEEIAQYHFQFHQLSQAELAAEKAFQLIEHEDHGIIRGRVYRLLGRIAATRGDFQRACALLRMSLDLLRRVRAFSEMEETERYLAEARKQLAPPEEPVR